MIRVQLASVKPTKTDGPSFLVVGKDDEDAFSVLKSYNTSASDARIFADVLCKMSEEHVCAYPDKIVKSKGETAAEPEAAAEPETTDGE